LSKPPASAALAAVDTNAWGDDEELDIEAEEELNNESD
jgi:hypothetical protein